MGSRRLLALVALVCPLVAAAPASAADAPLAVSSVDLLHGSALMRAGSAVHRSCLAAPLSADDPGVVLRHVTVGIDGLIDARLAGAAAGPDWDLAVFDTATGRLVSASAAFGANEVASAPVAAGTPLTIQACRYGGEDTPVPMTVKETVVSGDLPKAETQSLVRIPLHSEADGKLLQAAGIDLNETSRGQYIDAVAHGADDLQRIKDLGFDYTVRVPDLAQEDHDTLVSDAQRVTRSSRAAALPSGRTTYRTLAEYEMDLKTLVTNHPGVVRPVILPHKSIEGRTVQGVEIASDVASTTDGRPVVFQLGLHHVREWPSGEMPMEYAEDLFTTRDAADGARKQKILDGVRQYVIPVVNPDGLVATQLAGATDPLQDDPDATLGIQAVGAGAYRRKNCSNGVDNTVPLNAPCSLQPGVDLNRNYGAFWGGPGESDNLAMQTYRGPAPFSEPEAQNIHDLSSGLQVMIVNSNHTFAGDVLFQPGFNGTDEPGLPKGTKVPYQDDMKALSDQIAAAAGYASFVSYNLYDVTGATEDWNYFAQGAFGYTTETSYDNFHPNYQDGVIDQYLGTIDGTLDKAAKRKPSSGLRESMLLTAEAGLKPAYHSQVQGTAPAGRILRLKKDFSTSTSNVESQTDTADTVGAPLLIPEHLNTTLTVPASGRYTWAIDPSTRPVELIAGRTEAWTMTCEDTAGRVYETRQVTVAIGQSATQDFACDATTTPGQPGAGGSTPPTGGSTPGTGGSTPAGGGSTPGTGGSTPAGGGTGTPTTGQTGSASNRVLISRPPFSAKRTKRVRSLQVRLRLIGTGTLKNVTVRILDANKHVLFAGRLSALTGAKNVRLKPRGRLAALKTGPVQVVVTATDAGKAITIARASTIKR